MKLEANNPMFLGTLDCKKIPRPGGAVKQLGVFFRRTGRTDLVQSSDFLKTDTGNFQKERINQVQKCFEFQVVRVFHPEKLAKHFLVDDGGTIKLVSKFSTDGL